MCVCESETAANEVQLQVPAAEPRQALQRQHECVSLLWPSEHHLLLVLSDKVGKDSNARTHINKTHKHRRVRRCLGGLDFLLSEPH